MKIQKFTVLLLAINMYAAFSCYAQTPMLTSYYKALTAVEKSLDAFGGNASLSMKLRMTFTGEEIIYGHYAKPESGKTLSLSAQLSFSNDLAIGHYAFAEGGQEYRSRFLITGDSSYITGFRSPTVKKAPLISLVPLDYFYSPNRILHAILTNKQSLHWVTDTNDHHIVGFNSKDGRKYYVHIRTSDFLIGRIESIYYDPIYGDTSEEVVFEEYGKLLNKSTIVPAKIIVKRKGFIVRRLELSNIIEDETFLASTQVALCSQCAATKATESVPFKLEPAGSNLWVLKLVRENNKMLVFEGQNSLSVFEAPISPELCDQAIQYLEKHFSKPVHYCFLTHHHPDHAGGLLAFAKSGSTIVTTPDNVGFFNMLSSRPHSIGSRIVDLPALKFDIVPQGEKKDFTALGIPVKAYEGGSFTHHTNEYLFYYFPENKILFVGDLVFFPTSGVMQQGDRAHGVYQFIKANKLKVDRIITSWPLHDQRDHGTMQDLISSLSGAYPTLKK